LTVGKKREAQTWGLPATGGQSASTLHPSDVMLHFAGILAQVAPSHFRSAADGCAPPLASQTLKSKSTR